MSSKEHRFGKWDTNGQRLCSKCAEMESLDGGRPSSVCPGKRKDRYNHSPTRGMGMPSSIEGQVYQMLLGRQERGEIEDLVRQPTVVLQDGPSSERIAFKPDFGYRCVATQKTEYAEAKTSLESEAYLLKLKLWRAARARLGAIEIWKPGRDGPMMTERIE